MKPARPQTEPSPLTQLRKAVVGGSPRNVWMLNSSRFTLKQSTMSVIRWLGLAGLICLTLVLLGCSPDKATDGEKRYVIATVVKVDGIAWFETMRQGVEAFGKDTGHQVFVRGPAKADAAEQVQIIEGLIAQQVDAICVVPFSVEAVEPVLKKARDRGIVVISHEASSQQNADLIIEPFENAEYGRHLMDHLARFMGEKGEYATFVGSLTSKSHNEWVDAAVAHQKEAYPGMVNVAAKIEDYDDQNVAYQRTRELITTYPNLTGILGSAMSTVPGAALAVEERGLQDRIQVVGTSLVSVSGPYLKSGAAKLIAFWNPDDAGYAMNKLALMLLEGNTVEEGADLGIDGYRELARSPDNPNLFYGSAWMNVTKENLAQFETK
jgi:simple sugar transport system substrate-binding protein